MTYVFDETVGLSAGQQQLRPIVCRARAHDRRKLSAGFNYQRTSYDTFEGRISKMARSSSICASGLLHVQPPARSAILRVLPAAQRHPPDRAFEGDIIEASLSSGHDAYTGGSRAMASLTVGHRSCGPFVRVNLDVVCRRRSSAS